MRQGTTRNGHGRDYDVLTDDMYDGVRWSIATMNALAFSLYALTLFGDEVGCEMEGRKEI